MANRLKRVSKKSTVLPALSDELKTTTVVKEITDVNVNQSAVSVLLNLSQQANDAVNNLKGEVVETDVPVKKATKAKKSPRKPSAKKSPRKTSTKKTTTKKVVKKTEGKTTKHRVHNTRPTSLDITGIGIGSARVKQVLSFRSLNPREAQVRAAILKAANRPKKPKPTKENPNPEMPEQGKQIPVNELPEGVLSVIRDAEAKHMANLREQYERNFLHNMDSKTKAAYQSAKREASNNDNFVLEEFNRSFDPNFYNGLSDFVATKDCYVARRDGSHVYDEWDRAMALVNRLCTRLSGNTRYIIASFLDCIIEQFAYNGISNCLLEKKTTVQLRHALHESEMFSEHVPVAPFIKTFKCYGLAQRWFQACEFTRHQADETRAASGKRVKAKCPAYPTYGDEKDFKKYITDICRSVKMRSAQDTPDPELRANCLKTNISHEFRAFGVQVVNETILRIGACLRESVERSNVRTISDAMVLHVLKQIHNVCGMDFNKVHETMNRRLSLFERYRAERKAEREKTKSTETTETTETTKSVVPETVAEETDDDDDDEEAEELVHENDDDDDDEDDE